MSDKATARSASSALDEDLYRPSKRPKLCETSAADHGGDISTSQSQKALDTMPSIVKSGGVSADTIDYSDIENFLMQPNLRLRAVYQKADDGLVCQFLLSNVRRFNIVSHRGRSALKSVAGTYYLVSDLKRGDLKEVPFKDDDEDDSIILDHYERLNHRHIALIFLNYFHIKLPNILSTINPFTLACCCYDIYSIFHNEETDPDIRHLIAANCIRDYFDPPKDHDRKPCADVYLEDLFKSLNHVQPKRSCKNQGLISFLKKVARDLPIVTPDFQHHLVERYSSDQHRTKENSLNSIISSFQLSLAPAKKSYRIEQKYEEYASQFIFPGFHVYRRFKDLFRTTLSYSSLQKSVTELVDILAPHMVEVKINATLEIVYVIVNCDNDLIEIQIVKQEDETQKKHAWYELTRENTVENLRHFIERNIPKDTSLAQYGMPSHSHTPSSSLGIAFEFGVPW